MSRYYAYFSKKYILCGVLLSFTSQQKYILFKYATATSFIFCLHYFSKFQIVIGLAKKAKSNLFHGCCKIIGFLKHSLGNHSKPYSFHLLAYALYILHDGLNWPSRKACILKQGHSFIFTRRII